MCSSNIHGNMPVLSGKDKTAHWSLKYLTEVTFLNMVWNIYHFPCHNEKISYLMARFGETSMGHKALQLAIKLPCLIL